MKAKVEQRIRAVNYTSKFVENLRLLIQVTSIEE